MSDRTATAAWWVGFAILLGAAMAVTVVAEEQEPAPAGAAPAAPSEQAPDAISERQKLLQQQELERQWRQQQFEQARRQMARQRANLTGRHDRLDQKRGRQRMQFEQYQSERSQMFQAPDGRAAIPGRTLGDTPQYVPSLGQNCVLENAVVRCRR